MEGFATSLIFILSLWVLVIGFVWWVAALLPAVRQTFPYSLRSSLIVLALGALSASGSLGVLGLQQGWRALGQLRPPWQLVRVSLESDPAGAWVFLGDDLAGFTPITLELPTGTHRYTVLGDPRLVTPFQGSLQASEDLAVNVWLERRSELELRRFILEEEAAFLGMEEVSEGLALLATSSRHYDDLGAQLIKGTVQAERAFSAVIAAVALYNDQNEVLDIMLDGSGSLKAGETWTFLLPVTRPEVSSHRLLRLQGF